MAVVVVNSEYRRRRCTGLMYARRAFAVTDPTTWNFYRNFYANRPAALLVLAVYWNFWGYRPLQSDKRYSDNRYLSAVLPRNEVFTTS